MRESIDFPLHDIGSLLYAHLNLSEASINHLNQQRDNNICNNNNNCNSNHHTNPMGFCTFHYRYQRSWLADVDLREQEARKGNGNWKRLEMFHCEVTFIFHIYFYSLLSSFSRRVLISRVFIFSFVLSVRVCLHLLVCPSVCHKIYTSRMCSFVCLYGSAWACTGRLNGSQTLRLVSCHRVAGSK